MKLITIACMYNESEKGNIRRALDNFSQYSDGILIWDDGSTDDSVEIAKEYTKNIILGEKNDFLNETIHLKRLMDDAIKLEADWIFKMDMDEVLDHNGTDGGLRNLCENADADAYTFKEITLWRSDCYRRVDYLDGAWFNRLWKNNSKLTFPISHGLHQSLYPKGLGFIKQSPFSVIHYGYANADAIARRWVERTILGVPKGLRARGINEGEMVLEHVPHEIFPKGCEPIRHVEPKPIDYTNIIKKWEETL